MSRFQTFNINAGVLPNTAQIKNVNALVKALADLGFNNVELHQNPQSLYGYVGDVRAEKAEVIIRRQYVGSASNDIGFKKRFDGTFEAIISDYDRGKYSQDWLNQLAERYAYHAGISLATVTTTSPTISQSNTTTNQVISATSKALSQSVQATGAVLNAGAKTLGALFSMPIKAFQAYQKRQEKEKQAALKKEQEVQAKITQIKALSSSQQPKVTVNLTPTIKTYSQPKAVSNTQLQEIEKASVKDAQRQVDKLKGQLPKIRSEYQNLINQQLLDSVTVQQAIVQTEQALNSNNLAAAEAYLQSLDDARIQVLQQLKSYWQGQFNYLQERLEELRERLPQAVFELLQSQINSASNNYQQLTDADILVIHQQINDFESQINQVQETAENLAQAWIDEGWEAQVLRGTSDGDVVIEIETHEGENTLMRVQFNGQQIDLQGPPEEKQSCATRPVEVMKRFQEQGYLLEWDTIDNQPVAEGWRYFEEIGLQGESSEVGEVNDEEYYEEDLEDNEIEEEQEYYEEIEDKEELEEDYEDEDIYYDSASSQSNQISQES